MGHVRNMQQLYILKRENTTRRLVRWNIKLYYRGWWQRFHLHSRSLDTSASPLCHFAAAAGAAFVNNKKPSVYKKKCIVSCFFIGGRGDSSRLTTIDTRVKEESQNTKGVSTTTRRLISDLMRGPPTTTLLNRSSDFPNCYYSRIDVVVFFFLFV